MAGTWGVAGMPRLDLGQQGQPSHRIMPPHYKTYHMGVGRGGMVCFTVNKRKYLEASRTVQSREEKVTGQVSWDFLDNWHKGPVHQKGPKL